MFFVLLASDPSRFTPTFCAEKSQQRAGDREASNRREAYPTWTKRHKTSGSTTIWPFSGLDSEGNGDNGYRGRESR